MAKVILGNHAAVFVPLQDRDKIQQFYRDVLGGKIASEEDQKDLFRIGDNFYLEFLYGDYPDESKFLRSGRSIWLEIKSDNVEEMSGKSSSPAYSRSSIYRTPTSNFQAPGGQCLRLVGINEDLSQYEGVGEGPNVERAKEAVMRL